LEYDKTHSLYNIVKVLVERIENDDKDVLTNVLTEK
jgi:hypothetical protein